MRAHKISASWISPKWMKSNERKEKRKKREKDKSQSVLTIARHWDIEFLFSTHQNVEMISFRFDRYNVPPAWLCLTHINHLFLVLNSALNFCLYCCVGGRFRQELRGTVRAFSSSFKLWIVKVDKGESAMPMDKITDFVMKWLLLWWNDCFCDEITVFLMKLVQALVLTIVNSDFRSSSSFFFFSSMLLAFHPLQGYPGSWFLCAFIFWPN